MFYRVSLCHLVYVSLNDEKAVTLQEIEKTEIFDMGRKTLNNATAGKQLKNNSFDQKSDFFKISCF